jgi:hypothetical protein
MKTPEETRYRFNLVTLTWEHTPVGKRPICCSNIVCGGNYCRYLLGGAGAELPRGASKQPIRQLPIVPTEAEDLRDLQCLELQAHTTRQQIRAIHDRRQARVLEAKRQERIAQDNLFRKLLDDATFQVWRQVLLHGEAVIYIGDDCYVISDDDGRPSPELQQFMAQLVKDIEGQFIHKWERQYPKDDTLIYEVVGADVQGDRVTYSGPLRFVMSPTGV